MGFPTLLVIACSAASTSDSERYHRWGELRRETVMREARSHLNGKFMPKSADELFDIVMAGTRGSVVPI